jgi:hypothetical protein
VRRGFIAALVPNVVSKVFSFKVLRHHEPWHFSNAGLRLLFFEISSLPFKDEGILLPEQAAHFWRYLIEWQELIAPPPCAQGGWGVPIL